MSLNVTATGERTAAVAFYRATGWRYTHTTVAGWTAPDGAPVRVRHHLLDGDRDREALPGLQDGTLPEG
ncbi:hypothetical protein [Actinoplanes sp. G11-F43]|uniref:hypothetical protein n=1 Tax=Actinoplanes sp. G11-F43 TaxID=3424130 RepID=UPI003D34D3EB